MVSGIGGGTQLSVGLLLGMEDEDEHMEYGDSPFEEPVESQEVKQAKYQEYLKQKDKLAHAKQRKWLNEET